MKKIIMTGLTGLVGMAAIATTTYGSQSMKVMTSPPMDVFTPKGFDSDDNAEVVLEGALTNFCFHEAPATARVDESSHRVYIDNKVYSFNGCPDAMMYIPYTKVLSLGVLPAANYEVWASNGSGGYDRRADLPVAQAQVSAYSPDDRLYAPVSEIAFLPSTSPNTSGDPSLVIKGAFSNSCLALAQVEVVAVTGNVVQVLPSAKWTQTETEQTQCAPGIFSFTKTIQLTGFPTQGDVLIHVRSTGGQALNRVITPLDRVGLSD